MNRFLAGVGRALLFKGNNLIGVAKTLTDSTYDFSITGEDIRGGEGNALWGKFFHDSNLNVTLTDAMFKLEYIAASLGVDIQQGGLSVAEETVAAGVGGSLTVTHTPVAFDGSMIGWFKKPSDENWTIGTFTANAMTAAGAQAGETYCVKYFYQNANARSITIKTQYVPSELHVVIMNDLFNGDISINPSDAAKAGRLIVDIPRLQMDGNQNLALTATGAATVALTGSALAVSSVDTCEEDPYYGTMTEEIFGAVWQDNVIALAIENGDVEINANNTETLTVRVVYNGMPSEIKDNSNFTFVMNAGTATGTQVSSEGVITAGSTAGTGYISVTLTGNQSVEPAYAQVTVAS